MLEDEDFRTLAAVRAAIRGFAHFTEEVVQGAGLTPQQHQVLVSLCAAESGELSIGELAKTLMLRHHSVSGLADRLEALGLVDRARSKDDRRVVVLRLTDEAKRAYGVSLAHASRGAPANSPTADLAPLAARLTRRATRGNPPLTGLQ